MESSIKIESIKTDNDGCKLIAFSKVLYFRKCKPQVTPCTFADYKNQLLRIFDGNRYVSFEFSNFKMALLFIRNYTSY